MASTSSTLFKEVLPKQGQLYDEDLPNMVLCKPKLLPLKSVTLEKLEKMQRDAEETVRAQELAASKQEVDEFGHVISDLDKDNATDAAAAVAAADSDERNRLVL